MVFKLMLTLSATRFAAYFGLGCPASQTDDLEYPFVNPYLRLQLLLSQEWLDSGSAPLAFKQGRLWLQSCSNSVVLGFQFGGLEGEVLS